MNGTWNNYRFQLGELIGEILYPFLAICCENLLPLNHAEWSTSFTLSAFSHLLDSPPLGFHFL